MTPEDIQKITKLITEDPDIFNEGFKTDNDGNPVGWVDDGSDDFASYGPPPTCPHKARVRDLLHTAKEGSKEWEWLEQHIDSCDHCADVLEEDDPDDPTTTCPGPIQLNALSLGELPPNQATPLVLHVDVCINCREALIEIRKQANATKAKENPLSNADSFPSPGFQGCYIDTIEYNKNLKPNELEKIIKTIMHQKGFKTGKIFLDPIMPFGDERDDDDWDGPLESRSASMEVGQKFVDTLRKKGHLFFTYPDDPNAINPIDELAGSLGVEPWDEPWDKNTYDFLDPAEWWKEKIGGIEDPDWWKDSGLASPWYHHHHVTLLFDLENQ